MSLHSKFGYALMALLVWSPQAPAGVYSSLEPRWALNANYFGDFQEKSLIPLKQLTTADKNVVLLPWQKFYHLAAKSMLFAKDPLLAGKGDTQDFEDRLNYAVCLLRVREPGKGMSERAKQILSGVINKDRDNFLALSTLGTANLMLGEYRSADANLGEAWRYWGKAFKDQKEAWIAVGKSDVWEKACAESFKALKPDRQAQLQTVLGWKDKDPVGLKERDFAWFAKCELYQRQLARLRLNLSQLNFAKALERLDPLFDPFPAPQAHKPLRFVGESGKFEPGKIAATEKAKLPEDAVEVVQQLLIWTPDDLRLFWLLGELLNSKGDPENAEIVFKEFLGKFSQQSKFNWRKRPNKTTGELELDPIEVFPEFISEFPEVGARLRELIDYNKRQRDQGDAPKEVQKDVVSPPGTTNPDEPKTVPSASLNLEWRTLVVGMGIGAIVGFFASWRLRDILRRRQQLAMTRSIPPSASSHGA